LIGMAAGLAGVFVAADSVHDKNYSIL
jgi:hypothetical protein